ncbi:prepilin-type N-terminal cleavage/methylation domain-containing protein [Candidatus Saccharibacteria bacterium TM7i]|nr:prepilin-type N-terminal cleavage/methylation domain-containing protein [Candidatus Saccharibacteria bacterium TM7i]
MKIFSRNGFTIIELVVVIAVIGILTAVVIVGYGAYRRGLADNTMKSDLRGTSAALNDHRNFNNEYPDNLDETNKVQSEENSVTYTRRGVGFCLEVTSTKSSKRFYKTEDSEGEGLCPPPAPIAMQMLTTGGCSTTRMLAFDVRDGLSYWVQKLADGKCWMLTSLAYSGRGTDTYGDAQRLEDLTSDTTFSPSTPAFYANSSNRPFTPTAPSISTDGGATGEQYGYLYNWCAAMGGQARVCQEDSSALDSSISICPAGWRLPSRVEYQALIAAIGATNSTAGSQVLRTTWLAQYSGHWGMYGWIGAFDEQGTAGYFWSGTEAYAGSVTHADGLAFTYSSVGIASAVMSDAALAVRCMTK